MSRDFRHTPSHRHWTSQDLDSRIVTYSAAVLGSPHPTHAGWHIIVVRVGAPQVREDEENQ